MPKDQSNSMGGKGFGPDKSPGNGRGKNSVMFKNPAPEPKRGGFSGRAVSTPDSKKIESMQKQEHMRRESGRGKGSI